MFHGPIDMDQSSVRTILDINMYMNEEHYYKDNLLFNFTFSILMFSPGTYTVQVSSKLEHVSFSIFSSSKCISCLKLLEIPYELN